MKVSTSPLGGGRVPLPGKKGREGLSRERTTSKGGGSAGACKKKKEGSTNNLEIWRID